MKNTYKNFANEEQVKDYLLNPYLESLDKVCEYARTEPGITRIAVLRIGDCVVELAVWLADISEENCDRIGAKICAVCSGGLFPDEFYPAGKDVDRGFVVYDEQQIR